MQVSQSAVKRFKAVSFSVGDEVSHQKFGDGEITEVNGNKLTVNFKRAGTKRVVDSFVTLCAKKSAEIIPFPAHRIVRRVEFGKVVSS
jgi:transcription elongation factor GreA-like protein